MTRRSLLALAGVWGVLILSSAALWRLSKPGAASGLAAAALLRDAVALEIAGAGGAFRLSRSSASWRMDSPVEYPADSGAVQGFLDRLSKSRPSEELSSDPRRFSLFELDESSAVRVRLFSREVGKGPPSLEFFVGKGDYGGAYLRFPGKGVVLAQGLSASDFRKPHGYWLDKTVCGGIGPEAVLSVRHKEGRVTLSRPAQASATGAAAPPRPSQSPGPGGETSAEGKWERVLRVFDPLEAEELLPALEAPSREKMGLLKPYMEVDISFAGKREGIALRLGGLDERGYRYLEKEGEKRVYFLVPDWKFDVFRDTFPPPRGGK